MSAVSFIITTVSWLGPLKLSSCNALLATFAVNLSLFAQDSTYYLTALVMLTDRGGLPASTYKTKSLVVWLTFRRDLKYDL